METTATIERARPEAGGGPAATGWAEERWRGLSDLEPGLRRLLATRCQDENDVDDVIQETYLRAARYRASADGQRSLRAWAGRIALNCLSDLRRRAARSQPLPGIDGDDEGALPDALVGCEEDEDVVVGSGVLPSDDALRLVEAALGDLDAFDRRLLELYYHEGCAVPLCAARMGVAPHLVKVRLYRARRRLLALTERRLTRRRIAQLFGGPA